LNNRKGDLRFNAVAYCLSIIVLILVVYPLYFIILASFSEPVAVASGKMWLVPNGFTLDGYKELLNHPNIWVGYKNTILYTIVGTFIGLAVNIPAAFALSRKDLVGNKVITFFFIFTMFFNGGLIPTFMTIKEFGLYNTFTVMVLPFSVSAYNVIVARAFFSNNIPEDLWDASRIDGCRNLQYFFKVVLPLSKAIISVLGLWIGVSQWNTFFFALIYIRNDALYPLQLVLRNILIVNYVQAQLGNNDALRTANLLRYSVIIVATVPVLCAYPFVQKHFNQGVMIGAVKA
jgi:putative aldouronate transport system permease protein